MVAPNSPPTVSVTEPAAGEVFYGDSMDIVISANASDSEGTVTKVEFFEGTTLLGEAVSSPYSFEWLAVGVGSYTLTAKATDDGGMTSTSGPVSITVENALDDDGDGVTNDQDSCSDTPSCATVDTEGCPSDSDGDAVHDGCDQCPDDPDKTEAGDCGCGLADADSDGDGVPDCIDNCIDDQNPEQADSDANGIGDACDTIAPNEGDGDDTGDDGADDEGDVDDDNDEDTDEDDAADDGDDNADDDCRHTGDEDEDPDDEDDDEDDGDDGSEADDVDNGDADDVADDDPDEVTEQEAPRRFGSGNASAPGMCGNGIALAMITSFLASLALRFTGKRRSF